MEITIFAKKRTTSEGKTFYGYLSRLAKKDGSEQMVGVRFRDECGAPKAENCPMNIVIEKKNANLASHDFIRDDTGEVATSYTLWVSAWEKGSEYVDKSLDDYI